jgi:hypothetical protein
MTEAAHVIADIPVQLPAQALMDQVRVRPGTDDAREFLLLADQATRVARPKAMVLACSIEARGDQTVTVGRVTFTSRALRMNLDACERVFAFVATCGHEMDEVSLQPDDVLQAYWWDTLKAAALGLASAALDRYLAGVLGPAKTATMSPGEGEVGVWPIEQQRELFALLGDVKGRIGVVLTDSLLMIPNKTRSGIVFPSDKDYHTCQLCQRPDCPGRRRPFDPQLWVSIQPSDPA